MKKIFACVLAIVMLFTLCACGSNSDGEPSTVQPVDMDIEVLRADWRDGKLVLADGKSIDLPCTFEEIIASSGLRIANEEGLKSKVLQPDETVNFNLVGDNIQIKLTFKNKTEEPLTADKATIVSYYYTNVQKGNVAVKFANALTVNVKRSDVEDSLGLPDGATSEDVMYTYDGRDEKNRKVELKVSFNSSDLVNYVAFNVGTI